MGVVWIVNQFAPAANISTSRHRHVYISQSLAAAGHEVVVISSAMDHKAVGGAAAIIEPGLADVWNGSVRHRVVSGLRAKGPGLRLAGMRYFEAQVLRQAGTLPPPDLVVGSSVSLFAGRAALRLSMRLQARFVFEERDIWPKAIADVGLISERHPAYLWLQRLERRLYRQADRIVTVLPRGHVHVQQAGADPTKVVWIPNMVDMAPYLKTQPKSVRQPSAPFVVLHLGSMGPVYRLETALKAANLLRNAGVVFRFTGSGSSATSLRRMADRMDLTNVQFTGRVEGAGVPSALQGADAGLATFRSMSVSRDYGMSLNKVFEYLGSGTPVIYAIDAYNDPVAEAGAGLSIPADSPSDLADAALRMSRMPIDRLQRLGERGKAYAISRHSTEVIGARFCNVVTEVLNGLAPGTLEDPLRITS